jgi:hypothetical protein
MKNVRRGLGKGLGCGYKNIAPMDSYIHSLSAKGKKTYTYAIPKVDKLTLQHWKTTKGAKDSWMQRYVEGQQNIYVEEANTKKQYKRIRYGDEEGMPLPMSSNCPDCGVPKNRYHFLGCDIEESPIPDDARSQLLTSDLAGDYFPMKSWQKMDKGKRLDAKDRKDYPDRTYVLRVREGGRAMYVVKAKYPSEAVKKLKKNFPNANEEYWNENFIWDVPNVTLDARGLKMPDKLQNSKVVMTYQKENLSTNDVLETLHNKMDLQEHKDFDVAFDQNNKAQGVIFLHTDRGVARVLQSNAFKGKAQRTNYKQLAKDNVEIMGVA